MSNINLVGGYDLGEGIRRDFQPGHYSGIHHIPIAAGQLVINNHDARHRGQRIWRSQVADLELTVDDDQIVAELSGIRQEESGDEQLLRGITWPTDGEIGLVGEQPVRGYRAILRAPLPCQLYELRQDGAVVEVSTEEHEGVEAFMELVAMAIDGN